MPLMRAAMYSKWIEFWRAPTMDSRDSWLAFMRHIVVEGRCFVLSCNQIARRSDYPAAYPGVFGDDPSTVVSRGGSCIVHPFSDFLKGPNFEGVAILTAEIDRGAIARCKYDSDVTGHYARPDVFRLIVDERRKSPVVALVDGSPNLQAGRVPE